jgi:lipopolysaccharide/colanic/teichoic acid biosynthesis glycosyltransferase
VIAFAIAADSGKPIFYRGFRTGLNGKAFRIFKFRTMVKEADKIGGPSTGLNDPRLTKLGKILRKHKIDELPQIINIMVGDMSFVGPRPQVEEYTRRYSGEERIILSVKPGLTDYASLKFINLDTVLGDGNVDEKYLRDIEPEKNRLRVLYAKKCSFTEDMRILSETIMKMLKIRSRWNIGH